MPPGIVAESDLSGTLKSEYVFFDGERVARKDFPGNTVAYYFSDHLKTASVITDSAGNIKAESDYYPWGGELQLTAHDSNHYKFTSKERDGETGLGYFGARYYSNALGRWMSPDWSTKPVPIRYADISDSQTLNLYGYLRALPTSLVDQNGHGDAMTGYYQCLHNPTCAAKPSMHETAGQALAEGAVMGAWVGGALVAPAAAPIAQTLFGWGLATAPVTVPIAANLIEGATPGAPRFYKNDG